MTRHAKRVVSSKFLKVINFVDLIASSFVFHYLEEFLKNLCYFLFYKIFNILNLVMYVIIKLKF